jgi:RNA polymerase sigma-70 factor (ECF subfamily)
MVSINTNPEPAELLVRARAGDGAALGRLLERYRGYLKVLARLEIGRRLSGKMDPSDLVQETFLEAHRDFSRFRGGTEAEFTRWLRRVLATNLANAVRRYVGTKRRDVRLERELAEEIDESSAHMAMALAGQESSPSRQAARREEAVTLADALAELPEDYREVLVLRHLEGLAFAAVAARMGRTEDSVKNLWARALARLRRVLGAEP